MVSKVCEDAESSACTYVRLVADLCDVVEEGYQPPLAILSLHFNITVGAYGDDRIQRTGLLHRTPLELLHIIGHEL